MTDDAPLDRLLAVRLQLPLDVHRFLLGHADDVDETVARAVAAYLTRPGSTDPRSN